MIRCNTKSMRKYSSCIALCSVGAASLVFLASGAVHAEKLTEVAAGRQAVVSSSQTLALASTAEPATAVSSMPALLRAYAQDYRFAVAITETFRIDATELERLRTLTPGQIAITYPNGGYEAALAIAEQRFGASEARARAAQDAMRHSLMALTGGRALSSEALDELHQMLGI